MSDIQPTNLVTTDRPDTAQRATVRHLPWYVMILVRVVRVYLMTLLGLLGVGATGQLPATAAPDFAHVLLAAALTAIGPAVVSAIWNATELLAQLDIRQPQLRA